VSTRAAGARRGWEHRRERDERVEQNLPSDLVPLWRRVKRGLRCTTAHDCYEKMLQYAHDNPGEAVVAMAESAERDLEALLAAERRAIQDEPRSRGSLAFPPKLRKSGAKSPKESSKMARSSARRSSALARRSVSVKPVVIRQTKVVHAKKKRHGGGRRGGAGIGGFLTPDNTGMLMAGAAMGFIDKSTFVANLPKLPFLGEHGTIAVAAYMLGGNGRSKLATDICRGALFLSAYEMTKTGAITGDVDPFGM